MGVPTKNLIRTVCVTDRAVLGRRAIASLSRADVRSVEVDGRLATLTASEQAKAAARWRQDDAQQPFNLATGPLMRTTLLRLSAERHELLISLHHIVTDGWSSGVFYRELGELYEACRQGRPSPLAPLPIQYADFAVWQRAYVTGAVLTAQRKYWQEQLADAPGVLELPADRPRPAIQSHGGAEHELRVPRAVTAALKEVAQAEGCTLFMTLLAAFQVLLARYSGQTDIVVGSPIANRTRAEVEPLIGFFVNTLALRTDLSENPSFREVLQRVRTTTLGAYAHQDLPFEMLVDDLQVDRRLNASPLFQVEFVLQNAPWAASAWETLTARYRSRETGTTKFDLSLMMGEFEGTLWGTLEYATDLFDAATIERLASHFEVLLTSVLRDPAARISTLTMTPAPERRRLLHEWNATTRTYPSEVCLHTLVADQVARTPAAIAVTSATRTLTYLALDTEANQLARALVARGVGPDVRVGVCLERGADLVVALLAVLKAGGAYVPLDPAYPAERWAFMLADAGVRVCVAHTSVLGALRHVFPADLEIVLVGPDREIPTSEAAEAAEPTSRPVTSSHLAYLLYTSGSTGQPKGVMVTHRNVVNLLEAMRETISLGADDRFLAITPLSFDIAALELWLPLTTGARVVVADRGAGGDPVELTRLIDAAQITVMQSTPVTWRLLMQHGWRGRSGFRAICGGEELPSALAKAVLKTDVTLVNGYGPTETTIYSTSYHVCDATVSIGRPLANTEVYLVDRHFELVPQGAIGELLIGGDGVARGYAQRPALTAERFVPNPYGPRGSRLYRTGDAAGWNADGSLRFHGRLDNQIKLHGHRIELGEISSVLETHPSVRESAVLLREDVPGQPQLVAYVVPVAGLPALETDAARDRPLRQHLQARLPEYMVPSVLVPLAALPLTPNGKLDRQALPAPERSRAGVGTSYVAPRTATEAQLAAIWSDVLKLPQIGVEDSFFELGGHSLLATQVVSRVRERWNREVPLRLVFEQPTIAGFAAALADTPTAPAPIPRAARDGAVPLSFAQERLWFLDQLVPNSAFYTLADSVLLEGPLEVDALQQSLTALVARHEALRTIFPAQDGHPVQVCVDPATVPLPVVDLSTLTASEQAKAAARWRQDDAQQPFNLATGPLMRTTLLRLSAERHELLISLHHIVTDGWSSGVFYRELGELYEACRQGRPSPLAPLPIQYADFAVWQRAYVTGAVLTAQRKYWQEQLADAPGVLELPADRPRPAIPSYSGGRLPFSLPMSVAQQLRQLAQAEGCTLFMTLLAAFQVLLARYSGQTDIVVGSPIANRTRAEVEPLIGFFVNTLALRTDLSENPSFREVLQRVRTTTLGAYAHQDLPFEMLVDDLQVDRRLNASPIFQVEFVLQNAPWAASAWETLTARYRSRETGTTKFDLSLMMGEFEGTLWGTLEYATDLFEPETIAQLASHFATLLDRISRDPQVRLASVPQLTPAARTQLAQWNATYRSSPSNVCLHTLVADQVARTPAAIAVTSAAGTLTYQALDTAANQLAHVLVAHGVGPDMRVGVCLERSKNLVVALLAVLKAGGAYVPLDPAYPAGRRTFMLADAQVVVLLTTTALAVRGTEMAHGAEPPSAGGSGAVPVTLCIDSPATEDVVAAAPVTPPRVAVGPDHLAYVIYTSGSTGTPKGAMNAHRAVVNRLQWMQDTYGLTAADAVLQKTPVSFDVSVWEFFWPLLTGARLVMAEPGGHLDPAYLTRTIVAHRVTTVHFVPSMLQMWLDSPDVSQCTSLRQVICSGEALAPALQGRFAAQLSAPLHNLYGPTEAAIDVTAWACDPPRECARIPIGRPIANTQIHILGATGDHAPLDLPGELYIGGLAVGRGYLHRPALTAERFVPDQFSTTPGARLYRTGDRARWRTSGVVEYLGRLDAQVKLRGFRIELGEISSVLETHPSVRESAVLLREDVPGQPQLVAYVVPVAGLPALETDAARDRPLRQHLQARLPEYMVPSVLVPLAALPLTPNGKLDRQALPAPERSRAGVETSYVAPRTATEAQLAAIWGDVLKLSQIGVEDSFFELGGESLLATQVVSRVRDLFGIDLPLRALFEVPAIEGLARRIDHERYEQQDSNRVPLVPHAYGTMAPQSFTQERLWFIEQLEESGGAYNMPYAWRVRGPLDCEALTHSVNELIRRHESLRTRFATADGEAVQLIDPPDKAPLRIVEVGAISERELNARVRAEALARIDLSSGPLFRVTVFRLADDDAVLMTAMHHIISDGWSMGVLLREIGVLYEAYALARPSPLPPPEIQYADYAMWQREWLQGDALQKQLDYWKTQLEDAPNALELPTDRPRPAKPAFEGALEAFALSKELSQRLAEVATREGVTLYMLLLAALQVVMSRLGRAA